MPPMGIELSGLRATVGTDALAERQVRLQVEGGLLRLSPRGLTLLLPPGTPVAIHRIIPGRLLLRGSVDLLGMAVGFDAEVAPGATSDGRVRLQVVAVRAAGFLPVPVPAVIRILRTKLSHLPGIRFTAEDRMEIDLAEILRPLGVFLPPLKSAHARDGVAELEF
ncbi:MAG TPA: hypothetical protein VK689_02010 [Armatimonadota bacterium]|nr:hypothetical protein [Armatimonadota bacterium]